MKSRLLILISLASLVVGVPAADGATEQEFLERYAGMLMEFREQLVKCVPLNEERKQALVLLEAEIERQKAKLPSIGSLEALGEDDEADADVDGMLAELEAESAKPVWSQNSTGACGPWSPGGSRA